jgi:hypothetical protein
VLMQLGERESGTTRLMEAVQAHRAALRERTRGRVPLRWAKTIGNQGIALSLIANRSNDPVGAETAVGQIEAAYVTTRSNGDGRSAAYYQAELIKAQAIRDRLASVAKP